MPNNKIYWSKQDTPAELHTMLTVLAEEYPVYQGISGDGIQTKFIKSKKSGVSAVSLESSCATIKYDGIRMTVITCGAVAMT